MIPLYDAFFTFSYQQWPCLVFSVDGACARLFKSDKDGVVDWLLLSVVYKVSLFSHNFFWITVMLDSSASCPQSTAVFFRCWESRVWCKVNSPFDWHLPTKRLLSHVNKASFSSIPSYLCCASSPFCKVLQCVSKDVILHCVLLLQHGVDILNPLLVVSCIVLINTNKSLDGHRVFASCRQWYLGGVYY